MEPELPPRTEMATPSPLGTATATPTTRQLQPVLEAISVVGQSWLVVIASIVCILIVAVLGITIGVQRHKQDIAVQRKLLNSKALKSVRSPDAFDMVQLGKYSVLLFVIHITHSL